jgi:LacI family transcriptional regulator
VRHDLERIGFEGAELLARLIRGDEPPAKATLIPPCGIAERASTDTLAVSSEIVRRAKAIYTEEIANPPSTEILAARIGVSRATLDRAIAADIGMSSAKMLARLRLDEAKRLLRTGGLSVAEIAHKLGYCNPAYFVNTFRRATGSPPRAWTIGKTT